MLMEGRAGKALGKRICHVARAVTFDEAKLA
jgi:hypothetical protein